MTEYLTPTVTMVTLACGQCGCLFGLSSKHDGELRRSGHTFYCPNGHCRTYGETEAERLKAALARKEEALTRSAARVQELHAEKEQVERQLHAAQGVVTRTKRRISGGACPCCKRSFQNLARHMKAKHPAYAETETA